MDYTAFSIIAVAAVIYILLSALSLKISARLFAKPAVPADHAQPHQGFFKCCGIVILLNAATAAIFYTTFSIFDYFMRQPGARSSDAAAMGGIVYYPLILITTTVILKKLLPASVTKAILVNLAQIFASFMILTLFMLLSIMIAYDFGRTH